MLHGQVSGKEGDTVSSTDKQAKELDEAITAASTTADFHAIMKQANDFHRGMPGSEKNLATPKAITLANQTMEEALLALEHRQATLTTGKALAARTSSAQVMFHGWNSSSPHGCCVGGV